MRTSPFRRCVKAITASAFLPLVIADAPAQPAPRATPASPIPMVLLQPGNFLMGSPDTEPLSRIDESQHRVLITEAFWLSAVEVSQALWLEVMGENPSYFTDCRDCPVERITWHEAIRFCNELSLREGFAPAYLIVGSEVAWLADADGYRLPTEAEWEYACRAGTTGPYATGACLRDSQSNFDGYRPLVGCADGLFRGEPVEIASFAPNGWGLHDMHGNVAEWCWDWYGPYELGVNQDPTGPVAGGEKVTRGGSWACPGNQCRSAFRASLHPDRQLDMLGLRLARSTRPTGTSP